MYCCIFPYGDNAASKYRLKTSLFNDDLYRPAERNTEHDRNLSVPEVSYTDVCSFSWLLLNGELVEWLKLGDSWILTGLSGAAFHFWKCDETLYP